MYEFVEKIGINDSSKNLVYNNNANSYETIHSQINVGG